MKLDKEDLLLIKDKLLDIIEHFLKKVEVEKPKTEKKSEKPKTCWDDVFDKTKKF